MSESRGFQTAESTQQLCSASKGSHNWTEGQNKGRKKVRFMFPKYPADSNCIALLRVSSYRT